MPSRSHSRSKLLVALNLVAVLIVASTALADAPNESQGVQLILGTHEVSPTSTFELRFDEAMASPQMVGLSAQNSPLVITPALPGSFVWLSHRSGVFTPSEPLALATTYQLRLAADLIRADGKPSDAKLEAQVQSPPMSVTGVSPSCFRGKDAPSSSMIVTQFNVRVKPEALGAFHRVPGCERPLDRRADLAGNVSERLFPGPCHQSNGDRFKKLPADFEIKIGKVRAFAVDSVEEHNTLESGKWIHVEFTKSLSPLLKVADAPQWVSVKPAPADLQFDLDDSSIAVHGDFQLDQHYTVRVNQGLPAEEPPSAKTRPGIPSKPVSISRSARRSRAKRIGTIATKPRSISYPTKSPTLRARLRIFSSRPRSMARRSSRSNRTGCAALF